MDAPDFEVVLDSERGIKYNANSPPILHAHAIESHRHGLHHLARMTRELEQAFIDDDKYGSGGGETHPDFGYWYPVEICRFDWFAISLTNYLRLISLVDQAIRNGWSITDLVDNAGSVTNTCTQYIDDIVPSINIWRNKVSAHPAATAPKGIKNTRDALGTLVQSYSYPVAREAGYFVVGRERWSINNEASVVKPWSLTATYERLQSRFWPESAIPQHRHRPGEEPKDEPGTYLHRVRRMK